MKKIFALLFILIIATGCNTANTWQGIYYPNGTSDENSWVYSPVFYDYEDCKTWVLDKKSDSSDLYSCGKNCIIDEYGLQTCEDVVRNWQPFYDSLTFDNYKE